MVSTSAVSTGAVCKGVVSTSAVSTSVFSTSMLSTNTVSTNAVSTNAFFFSFTDDEDLSTISDDFESMSIQSSTEDSQNEQSCSSRYILILFNYKNEILIKSLNLLYNIKDLFIKIPARTVVTLQT